MVKVLRPLISISSFEPGQGITPSNIVAGGSLYVRYMPLEDT